MLINFFKDSYGNALTKECEICPLGCDFCLGPDSTDCIVLEGTIIHKLSLNYLQIFTISFALESFNIDEKYNNAIKQSLIYLATNFL